MAGKWTVNGWGAGVFYPWALEKILEFHAVVSRTWTSLRGTRRAALAGQSGEVGAAARQSSCERRFRQSCPTEQRPRHVLNRLELGYFTVRSFWRFACGSFRDAMMSVRFFGAGDKYRFGSGRIDADHHGSEELLVRIGAGKVPADATSFVSAARSAKTRPGFTAE